MHFRGSAWPRISTAHHHRKRRHIITGISNSKSSTIIASQLPVAKWYEIIGEATIADAILDRLVHASHRIELKGESLRKKL